MEESKVLSPDRIKELYEGGYITCNEAVFESIFAMRRYEVPDIMNKLPIDVRDGIKQIVADYGPSMACNRGPEYIPTPEIVDHIKAWFSKA